MAVKKEPSMFESLKFYSIHPLKLNEKAASCVPHQTYVDILSFNEFR